MLRAGRWRAGRQREGVLREAQPEGTARPAGSGVPLAAAQAPAAEEWEGKAADGVRAGCARAGREGCPPAGSVSQEVGRGAQGRDHGALAKDRQGARRANLAWGRGGLEVQRPLRCGWRGGEQDGEQTTPGLRLWASGGLRGGRFRTRGRSWDGRSLLASPCALRGHLASRLQIFLPHN